MLFYQFIFTMRFEVMSLYKLLLNKLHRFSAARKLCFGFIWTCFSVLKLQAAWPLKAFSFWSYSSLHLMISFPSSFFSAKKYFYSCRMNFFSLCVLTIPSIFFSDYYALFLQCLLQSNLDMLNLDPSNLADNCSSWKSVRYVDVYK